MLDRKTIDELARRLDQAEKTRTQIRQFSLEYPGITIDDAYAIQKAWVAMKVAQGPMLPISTGVASPASGHWSAMSPLMQTWMISVPPSGPPPDVTVPASKVA